MYYNRVELSKLEKEILLLSEENIKTLEEISKGESYMEEAKDKLVHLTEDSQWIVNIFLDNFYKDNCKRYCTGV